MTSFSNSSSDQPTPVVSVVIPTRNRADILLRSVSSALAQTLHQIEVIVIIDGYDPRTTEALKSVADVRLCVLQVAESAGAAEARNRGVQAARGAWIAFLDDDDEWLPNKLERQLEAVERSSAAVPVICSAYVARSSEGDHIFGTRKPNLLEPISEYMFARRGFAYGENAVATSVLVARRSTLLDVPFDSTLKRHQDWDWALRVFSKSGATLCHVPEPLSIYHMPEGVSRISGHSDWRYSLEWCRSRRVFFTPKAISFFVATECVTRARQSGAKPRELLQLIGAFFKDGRPTPRSIALLLWCLASPRALRRWLLRIALARKFAS